MVLTPYVALPTNEWDGDDGNWSTFRISIGEPGQDFRVLVSTQAATAFVPVPEGCEQNDTDCPPSRGIELFDGQLSFGFNQDASTSWNSTRIYSLDLENSHLNFPDDAGYFGFDKVHLGYSQDKEALEVDKSLVVGYASPAYWVGLLGLNYAETDLESSHSIPSLIKVLNDTGHIPSLSYGYTAGAQYRYKSVPGSLVIGGYDRSRFTGPMYDFNLAGAVDRLLVVALQSINTNFSLTGPGEHDLATGHTTTIDSSVSHLWLPEKTCDTFANAFGLTYDEDANYYLINDTIHNKLLANNPTLKFTLAKGKSSPNVTDNIQIELPYAAFDLSIGPPAYPNWTHYFPIRRSNDESQNTIGRVFLQEAYLIVDYERQRFSLAQANFTATMPDQDIQTITPSQEVPPASASSLSGGAKAGIAVGAAVCVFIMLIVIFLYWWRPRRRAVMRETTVELQPNWQKAELPAGEEQQVKRPELDPDNGVYELNGGSTSCELPALVGGRQVQGAVYEMDASHELTSAIREDNRSGHAGDGRTVEKRGVSEQRDASGIEGPSS